MLYFTWSATVLIKKMKGKFHRLKVEKLQKITDLTITLKLPLKQGFRSRNFFKWLLSTYIKYIKTNLISLSMMRSEMR